MKHYMKLQDKPFKCISNGSKVIEIRLYDEKRKLLKIGDVIEFTNMVTGNIIDVKVINLHKFNDFKELFSSFDKVSLGYDDDEACNSEDMRKYYSKEEEEKYGVLGIEIERIDK